MVPAFNIAIPFFVRYPQWLLTLLRICLTLRLKDKLLPKNMVGVRDVLCCRNFVKQIIKYSCIQMVTGLLGLNAQRLAKMVLKHVKTTMVPLPPYLYKYEDVTHNLVHRVISLEYISAYANALMNQSS